MTIGEPLSSSIQTVHRVPLFAGLQVEQLETVLETARRHQIPAGDRFFLQGDPARTLYVVVHGQVRITQVTPDGQQVLLRLIGPNQMFGAIAAIERREYPASAEAVVACEVLAWDGDTIRNLLDRFPPMARNMMRLMASQIQLLQDRLREMTTERVERRIAHTLLRLIRHAGRKVDDGVLLDLSLTRQDLAEMTGTTLYTASRILSRWETDGIIQSERQRILVRVPHRLVTIAEDLPPDFQGDARTE